MFMVVGSVTVDIFVKGIHRVPQLGEDEFNSSNLSFTDKPTTIHLGGNGGNSAYILAGFDAQTYLCSAIGNDELGQRLVDWLKERSVDLTALHISEEEATSSTTVLVNDDLDRLSFHHLGSTATLQIEHFPPAIFEDVQMVLISGFSLLQGLRTEGYRNILEQSKAAGAVTAFDIGPAIGRLVEMEELQPLLPLIDCLIANQFEARTCTGVENPIDAAKAFLAAGAQLVVIKRGKEGALAITEKEIFQAKTFDIKASVTVGAGDAFNAGFLYAFTNRNSLQQSLKYGNATAALVLSSNEGTLGAPSWQSVKDFVSEAEVK